MKRRYESDGLSSRGLRVLIHAHVFYGDVWPELAVCIENFAQVLGWNSIDLRVTVSNANPLVADIVGTRFAEAKISIVENRGYDVAPFLMVLDGVSLDEYDYVVKLHTKRDVSCWMNFRLWKGNEWRHELLSFCDTVEHLKLTLKSLARQPRLGMIAGAGVIDPVGAGMSGDFSGTEGILHEIWLREKSRTVVYGTMFIVRAVLLKPIWRKVSQLRFAVVAKDNAHTDFGLSGDLEGLFGMMVTAQGCYVGTGRHSAFLEQFLMKTKSLRYRLLRWISPMAHKILRTIRSHG